MCRKLMCHMTFSPLCETSPSYSLNYTCSSAHLWLKEKKEGSRGRTGPVKMGLVSVTQFMALHISVTRRVSQVTLYMKCSLVPGRELY